MALRAPILSTRVRSRKHVLAVAVASGLLLAACTSVDGRFTARSPDRSAEWKLAPDTCRSALTLGTGMNGVLFESQKEPRFLIGFGAMVTERASAGRLASARESVAEEDLYLVVRNRSTGEEIEFRRPQCNVLDGDLRKENLTVNRVRALSGHVRLSCAGADGMSFDGDVTFRNCSL